MKALSIILWIIILFQFACTTEPENNYINYKIHIDKIEHPDTISVNDTLTIKFFGFVGSDGCHGFSHFKVSKKTNDIEFTVWGVKPNFNTLCPSVLVYLEGKEYKSILNKSGLYRIKINQPNNTFLVDTVFVQ